MCIRDSRRLGDEIPVHSVDQDMEDLGARGRDPVGDVPYPLVPGCRRLLADGVIVGLTAQDRIDLGVRVRILVVSPAVAEGYCVSLGRVDSETLLRLLFLVSLLAGVSTLS